MKRGGLIGLAAFAGGIAAGVAAEKVIYRRALGANDPEAKERFGDVRGDPVWVESFDGTRLYAEVFGPPDAPGCVFAHGFTLTHDVWHYQLKRLASEGEFRLVAYDARGHGSSGPATGPDGKTDVHAETMAQDLYSVLHQTGVRPAVICGHSMGGMMAQAFVHFREDFPTDVGSHLKGLVLVCTTFTSELGVWSADGPRLPRVRSTLERAFERVTRSPRVIEAIRVPASDLAMLSTRLGFGRNASASQVAFTRRMMDRCPSETFAAAMRGLADFDVLDGLERIDVPVLITAGTRDLLTPAFLAQEMADRIPDAEILVYPGAGHMVMLERHLEFTDALRGFLKRVLADD